jgi:hypothetical protein
MAVLIPAVRAWGFAVVGASFAVAVVESGVVFHADQVLPGWDKAIHALCAFGLVLALCPSPGGRRRAVVAVIATGLAWEAVQFLIDPYQGHTPAIYILDTATDLAADVIGAALALRPASAPTAAPRVTTRATPR